MTSRSRPCPKLRVTKRAVTPRRPQNAQVCNELLDIDCDEDRATRWAELCDDRRRGTAERATADDVLLLPCLAVPLLLDDLAGEDDALEVKDAEALIIHLFRGMRRDHVLACANALAQPRKCSRRHSSRNSNVFWAPLNFSRARGPFLVPDSGPPPAAAQEGAGRTPAGSLGSPPSRRGQW